MTKQSNSQASEPSRKMALALIYRHTHRDYKGRLPDGTRTAMVCRGTTCLVSLDQLTDPEIADRLPYAQKKEAQRLAARQVAQGGV